MKRARLLIYEGSEQWLATVKLNEYIQEAKPLILSPTCSIRSVELNEEELTLFACDMASAFEAGMKEAGNEDGSN